MTEIGRIIEIIAQPVGPQKLGKSLQRCMQRKKLLERPQEALTIDHVTLSLYKDDPVPSSAETQGSDNSPPNSFRKTSPPQQHSHGKVKSEEQPVPDPVDRPNSRPGPSPQQGPQQTPQQSIDGSLPSVLVVDDNQINLQLMVTFVRKSHHPYESATDGQLAVEAYKRSATDQNTGQPSSSAPKRFKYILMDVQMPKMDGSTATRKIRKWEKENGIEPPAKIFALTGLGETGGHDWAHEAGFDRLLSKPIKFKELEQLLV